MSNEKNIPSETEKNVDVTNDKTNKSATKKKSTLLPIIVSFFACAGLALCFVEIATNVYNELQTREAQIVVGAAIEE